MTGQETRVRDSAHEGGDEQGPKAIWGHPLAAAGVCLGMGAVVALLGIFG
jgi:hypothetical protein